MEASRFRKVLAAAWELRAEMPTRSVGMRWPVSLTSGVTEGTTERERAGKII